MLKVIFINMWLQSELQHALDALNDKHTNIKMPSQSNVKSIVAYIEIGEYRIELTIEPLVVIIF